MSFKVWVPKSSASWHDYWLKKSIPDDLELCHSDQLGPIFKSYLNKKMTILEAGSGLGKWVINLRRQGYLIFGLDTYARGLERVKEFEPITDHIEGDVANLPIKTGSIDAYLSLGVVEHFEEGPYKPLNEAKRVLKEGGIGFIEVPFNNPISKIKRIWVKTWTLIKWPFRQILLILGLKKVKFPQKMAFYEYHYEISELLDFVNRTGFELIKILSKDDFDPHKSIGLWLEFPRLRSDNGKLFELNLVGQWVKKILLIVSPFSYAALIVAIVRKK